MTKVLRVHRQARIRFGKSDRFVIGRPGAFNRYAVQGLPLHHLRRVTHDFAKKISRYAIQRDQVFAAENKFGLEPKSLLKVLELGEDTDDTRPDLMDRPRDDDTTFKSLLGGSEQLWQV